MQSLFEHFFIFSTLFDIQISVVEAQIEINTSTSIVQLGDTYKLIVIIKNWILYSWKIDILPARNIRWVFHASFSTFPFTQFFHISTHVYNTIKYNKHVNDSFLMINTYSMELMFQKTLQQPYNLVPHP